MSSSSPSQRRSRRRRRSARSSSPPAGGHRKSRRRANSSRSNSDYHRGSRKRKNESAVRQKKEKRRPLSASPSQSFPPPNRRRTRSPVSVSPSRNLPPPIHRKTRSPEVPEDALARAGTDGVERGGGHKPFVRSRSRDAADGFGCGAKGKGKGKGKGKEDPEAPKEEPNFDASGLLALEDNSKNGVPLKFTRPPEARLPSVRWRLYIFAKQTEAPKILHAHRLPGYLFGKDRRVADVPTDHPTCSKQHAVLHYRLASTGEVKPYIMDLESTNGTYLNGNRIEAARYYEMRERDVLKFGMSSREFVLLHSGSANDQPIDPAQLQADQGF